MPVYYSRDDIVGVNFYFERGFQDSRHRNLLVISIYNKVVKAINTIALQTLFIGHRLLPVIVTHDLNIYHVFTQLDRSFNNNETARSIPFFDEAHNRSFIYTNKPGVITRWSDKPSKQDSCINLTFYNSKAHNIFKTGRPFGISQDQTIALHTLASNPLLIIICPQDMTGPTPLGISQTQSSQVDKVSTHYRGKSRHT